MSDGTFKASKMMTQNTKVSHCITVIGHLESDAHRQLKLCDFWSAVQNMKTVTSQKINNA
jgi:hypothetical protein